MITNQSNLLTHSILFGQNQQPEKQAAQAPVSTNTANNLPPSSKSAPLVSNAIEQTLLQLQESGNVLDADTTLRLQRQGVDENQHENFVNIIQKAVAEDGYSNPVNFIQNLSTEEIETLRQIHGLAESDGVKNADTHESAVNLILPPHLSVDSDNNGLVSKGTGTFFKFPPPNAPAEVKDAWQEMSEHMDSSEKLRFQSRFFIPMIANNLETDADGQVTGIHHPSDSDFTNVFGDTESQWQNLIQGMITHYENTKALNPHADKAIEELSQFLNLLNQSA